MEKVKNTELGQELFQKMAKKIQKALAQIEKQMIDNENVGGQYAVMGGAGGQSPQQHLMTQENASKVRAAALGISKSLLSAGCHRKLLVIFFIKELRL